VLRALLSQHFANALQRKRASTTTEGSNNFNIYIEKGNGAPIETFELIYEIIALNIKTWAEFTFAFRILALFQDLKEGR